MTMISPFIKLGAKAEREREFEEDVTMSNVQKAICESSVMRKICENSVFQRDMSSMQGTEAFDTGRHWCNCAETDTHGWD
jgi:hypothetical protein